MFETLLVKLTDRTAIVTERSEGVAFFKAAKDLYRLESLTYFCANIPVPARPKHFAHCLYSDCAIKHYSSPLPVDIGSLDEASAYPDRAGDDAADLDPATAAARRQSLVLLLRQRIGETAAFAIRAHMVDADWDQKKATLERELRILANYFHGHILRINGNDAEPELLVSARELDCLKWTAAGKTAWEASVILGISERTVRFHLNAAREKLNCATTTQAVAKAVANQLIDV